MWARACQPHRSASPKLCPIPSMNPSRPRHWLLATALILSSVLLHAEFIGWHPQLQGIRVGRGLDLNNQEDTKGFVAEVGPNPIPGGAGGGFEQSVRFVQDTFDMAQAFSLNARLSVRSKVYSGSVGYSQAEVAVSSGNRITFVMDCARVLPDELFAPTGLTPEFRSAVVELKRSYTGPEFEKQLARTYGTHYVSGVRRAFKAALVFTFTFDSQASARSQSLAISARYRGGVARGDFDADVNSFFARRDSRFSLSYEFRSLNPFASPPPFATNAAISNFAQFQTLANQFETYCRTVDLAQAVPITYTIERFRNIPAYQELVGAGGISDIVVPDYSEFMQNFTDLSGWLETLNLWTREPERMNWLNTKGRALVTAMRGEVDSQVRTMREVAKAHFETGTPLDVPADIVNYRANLAQIPVPRVVVFARYVTHNDAIWFGYVNAGPLDLTVPNPFQSGFMTYQGSEYGNEPAIFWSATDYRSHVYGPVTSPYFDANSARSQARESAFSPPRWTGLLGATNKMRLGFLLIGHGPLPASFTDGMLPELALNIKDAGFPPQTIDSLPIQESRTDQLDWLGANAFSGDVRLLVRTPDLSGTVGRSLPAVFTVTNAGPGAVFGTTVALPVPETMEVASASCSQGSATQSGRTVTFRIGALASGGSVTLRLGLIPLVVGNSSGPSGLSVSLAPEVKDPDASSNTLPLPVVEGLPSILKASSGTGTVRLTWTSDTDRLGLEEASVLSPVGSWTPSNEAVSANRSERSVDVPASGTLKLYRLTVK